MLCFLDDSEGLQEDRDLELATKTQGWPMLAPVAASADSNQPDTKESSANRPERLEPMREAAAESSATWDEREAVRTAASFELPADMLATGVERLSRIAGVATIVLTAYFAGLAAFVPRVAAWERIRATCLRLLIAAALLSAATYGITRIKRLRPQHVHDLGYVYLIVLTLLLGLLRHASPWPATELVRQVSPVALPILAFGALIPASPRTSVATLFGAACMDPLAFVMMRSANDTPRVEELVLLFASPLVAAVVAYQI